MDLILIRHGQSQWNADQTGGEDAPLTALGRTQAHRAGLYCQAQLKLSALYASTYQRARDTAQIINSYLNLDAVEFMPGLREFTEEYGFQMPRYASPLDVFRLTAPVAPVAISSYYVTFQERVQRAAEEILRKHVHAFDTDTQIGIVSHGGTMGTILRTLTGSHHYSLNTENTGIHILRWQDQRWHMIAINRVEHLECDRWQHEAGQDA